MGKITYGQKSWGERLWSETVISEFNKAFMQKGNGPEDQAGRGWETSIKGLGEEGVGKDEKGVGGASDTLPWGKEDEIDSYSGTDAAQAQGDGEPRLGRKAWAAGRPRGTWGPSWWV